MHTSGTVRRDRVKPGDLAQHRTLAYPPRIVADVDRPTGRIKIQYPGGLVSTWYPADNFTFTRETPA